MKEVTLSLPDGQVTLLVDLATFNDICICIKKGKYIAFFSKFL